MRIIAGPCQHESLDHSRKIAQHCDEICAMYGFEYIFKASYDKANRSSDGTQRGQGLHSTLEDFERMKIRDGYSILTDVHTTDEINEIRDLFANVIDVVQIPAFLCRQTDLVKKATQYDDWVVNIKKGQFLAPWDVPGILSKGEGSEIWVTERGTSFGYNTLVTDFTGVRWMLDNLDCPVVMDATHAVQRPGGGKGVSGGNRDYAPHMAYAAAAVGVENFFMEVHDDPDNAPSDGPNMIRLEDFESVVRRLKEIVSG
mgnify:CR=1 FL=1